MPVIESNHSQCPACGYPTRFGMSKIGEHSGSKHQCLSVPEITVFTIDRMDQLNGDIIYYSFKCAHCYYIWKEDAAEHNKGEE